MRIIALSIRDYALAESCRSGQDYDKGLAQINVNAVLYPGLRQKTTTIFDIVHLFLSRRAAKGLLKKPHMWVASGLGSTAGRGVTRCIAFDTKLLRAGQVTPSAAIVVKTRPNRTSSTPPPRGLLKKLTQSVAAGLADPRKRSGVT